MSPLDIMLDAYALEQCGPPPVLDNPELRSAGIRRSHAYNLASYPRRFDSARAELREEFVVALKALCAAGAFTAEWLSAATMDLMLLEGLDDD